MFKNFLKCELPILHDVFSKAQSSHSNSGCGCGCFPWFILILLVVGILSFRNDSFLSNRVNISDKSPTTLTWKSACGSSYSRSSVWYAVVGSGKALQVVKNKYCGDAFIASGGYVQVASFNSRDEAKQFADLLTKLSGYKFWVR